MLVSPLDPKVIATIDSVVTGAFSSILLNFINTITLVVNICHGVSTSDDNI